MKDNKHGFTLAELLVVIAIMMILAGVSFVGISSYIRNLHLVEMDNAAKEIFIVAQNHLSQAYASGDYLREKEEGYYGKKLWPKEDGTPKPNYLLTTDDTKAEYYYVVYEGFRTGPHEKSGVLGTMLPQYSIEEEIADYGNYLIVYEKNSATIVSVFYSGRSHTYFGSSPVHEFVAGSAEVEGNVDDSLKKAVGNKENRKHYLRENSVIGWYGSNGKKVVPSEAFNSIKLEITNGSRLTATVTNPNYTAPNHTAEATNQRLNLIVSGLTSGKEKILSLENYSKVDWKGGVDCKFDSDCILDDITSLNSHFCNKFPEFTPGEDVEIYAELSDTSRFVAPIKSNVCVVNSLFESYSDNESLQIAEIKNIRHLENLDRNVSNLGVTVTKAEQLDDLVYGGSVSEKTSFAEDITGVLGNNGQEISIYSSDDAATNPLSDKGYYGIYNSKLQAYDGQNHSIINLYSVTGDSGNTGIFAETGASGFEFRNLTVKDSSFIGTQDSKNSGGLVGHSIGGLKIRNCNFQGDDSTISASGDAGAMVGLCDGALTVSNCEVKGARLIVNSTSGNAGGLAANCGNTVNIRNGHISGSGLSIVGSASNSGGIIGTATGAVTMEACSAAGEKITISGKNAGGMIGNSAGAVIMSSCSAIGKNALISGENAGGIMGISNGGLNITNSYSSSFVFATVNAGGFIGYIESGNSEIKFCYSSGHTKDRKYGIGKNKTATADNYNVISDGIAGGFIGYSSAKTDIYCSYSTCSVYSSSSSGLAGGFVGKGTVLDIYNCYSAGPVAIAKDGTAGGFAGQGVNVHGNNYYLKGKGFNSSISAIGSVSEDIDLEHISSTGGSEISSSESLEDDKPWDSELSNEYPYWSIKEIPVPSELSGASGSLDMHYGDWTTVEQNKLVLKIRNAEKLTAILEVPTSEISTAAGAHNYASVCVEGISSGKIAYMQFELQPSDIAVIEETTALNNITASGGGDISDYNTVVFPEYTFPTDKTLVVRQVENKTKTQFYIDLDDITTVKKNFAAMFTGFEAGEDIRIIAEWGAVSWNTMLEAVSKSSKEESESFTGITNSLFASGSGNSSYTDSYYSDIDKVNNVQTPGVYGEIALISNFRHLQNLDTSVSGVEDNFKKATICRDLYWKDDGSDFVTAIKNGRSVKISIYPYTAEDENDAVATDDAFYGIVNDYLIELNGGGNSIHNIFIDNGGDNENDTENSSAGLFRIVDISNDSTNGTIKNIHDLSIVQPTIISRNGYAGGLIGKVSSTNSPGGELNITNVFVYGKDSLIRAIYDKDSGNNGTDAGGFIGNAAGGGYNITNCGSSSYVYAEEKALCAGGFIGDFRPKKASNVINCFVGGHINSSQDYVADYVVSGDSNIIDTANEGGYNICGNKAVGGFFGNLETNIDSITKIEHCFTTASVYCGESKSNDGAVGGFVGRIQYKHQQYSNCYMEGKVYAGTAYAGSFIGDYKQPGPSDNNTFENVYVLMGKDFNDDTNLKKVSFSHNSCTISGITPVAHDDTHIVQEDAGQMVVKTFNRTPANERFPYKDSTMIGTNHVFYGDWMVPEKIESIDYVINGNDLRFNIFPDDSGWRTENLGGKTYYVIYIRLKGKISERDFRWKVMFNEEKVIIKHADWNSQLNIEIAKFVTGILNNYLEITFDDISGSNTSFFEIIDGRTAELMIIPGEDVDFYVSDTKEGLNNEDSLYAEVNTLFQEIRKNDKENPTDPDTYTAYIANARHLENLNPSISNLGITVTKAIQTDNIYWKDYEKPYNHYETDKYTASYPPYMTENQNGNIHEFHNYGQGATTGTMMALKCPDLILYDGGGHTIYNMSIGKNVQDYQFGLFSSTIKDMTIQNLILQDPVISDSANPKALLVGKALNTLNVNNVEVKGDINIANGANAGNGGLIGECEKAVTIEDIKILNNVNIGGLKYIGGLVGKANNSVSVNNVKIYGNVNAVLGANYGTAGGMIGRSEGNVIITNSLINGYSAILIYDSDKAGGLVGGTGGTPNITGTSINGGVYINSNPDNRLVGTGQ